MGQFLRQTLASFLGTLIGLFVFVTLGASGLALLIMAAALGTSSSVANKSALVFDLSLLITDAETPVSLAEVALGDGTEVVTLRQVLNAINQAAKDDRIVALFLDGRALNANNGYGTLTEVRAALEGFRATGKKIIAYGTDWSEQNYFLASAADEVWVNPLGTVTVNGFSSEQLFFADALAKFGIGVQVVRVGSYKSAVEPFTRQTLSPESREQTQILLANLWRDYRDRVGKSRQLTPQQLQVLADSQGFTTATAAQKAKLVDGIAYFDEVVANLKTLTDSQDDNSFRQIDLQDYASRAVRDRRAANTIALVYAEGEIVDGNGSLGEVGGDRLAGELRKIREDESVKAVVLRINSPGGSATASEVIWRELFLIKQEKPLVISMGNVAASGGYWIATAGDYIFAEPTTITGSIGVFGLLPNVEQLANNNGINWDVVKTGKFSDLDSIVRPKNPAELAILQQFVSDTYGLFLKKVSESRKLPPEKVATIAQGRVWSGRDAHSLGLVDRLGGLEAALNYAAAKAALGDDWRVEEYPNVPQLGELLVNALGGQTKQASQHPLQAQLERLESDLDILTALNDPKGVYARLPFNLRID